MATLPSWPNLQKGCIGTNVRALQCLLNYRNNNNDLIADGDFGTSTYNAVVAYQRNNSLTQDGIAGQGTLSRLIVNLSSGASGNAVLAAQYLFYMKFEAVSVSCSFDSLTISATKNFQTKMGIASTGTIDSTTWQYLFGYPFYPSFGCDTITPIDSAKLQTLKDNGCNFVGRYLGQHSSGDLTLSEKNLIANGGLYIFTYWERGNGASYFTASNGTFDATAAIAAARNVNQPSGTPIYFAIDYDMTPSSISAYLTAIKTVFANSNYPYALGLYGSGAVLDYYHDTFRYGCLAGSTGWSGYNQAVYYCLKQYSNDVTIGTGSGAIRVDKVYSNGAGGGWQ